MAVSWHRATEISENIVFDDTGREVANTSGSNLTTDQEKADFARLIAAAPEMYESLRAMRDWTKAALECKSWHWDGDQREAAELELATAEAVLAKVGAP